MRILIVSDTHRKHANLEKVLKKVKPLDLMIHLGDAEGTEDYIEAVADCPVEIIAGNNDFFSKLAKETELQIGRYRVFLTHGHYENMGATSDLVKNIPDIRLFYLLAYHYKMKFEKLCCHLNSQTMCLYMKYLNHNTYLSNVMKV